MADPWLDSLSAVSKAPRLPLFHSRDLDWPVRYYSFACSTPLKRRARPSRATISSISCSSNPRSSTPRSNRPASGSKRPAAISAISAAARDGGMFTPLSKRSMLEIGLTGVGEQLQLGHRGPHKSRIDGEGQHAAVFRRVVETFGETHDRRLAGRIARSMREAVAGAATDQVDDAALASIEHRRRGHATGVEGATQIDLDILPPDIGVAFPYR